MSEQVCWECAHLKSDHDRGQDCMVGWELDDPAPPCDCFHFQEFESREPDPRP